MIGCDGKTCAIKWYHFGLQYFAKRNETKRNGTLRNGTLRNGTLRNGTLRNGYTSANAPKFFALATKS